MDSTCPVCGWPCVAGELCEVDGNRMAGKEKPEAPKLTVQPLKPLETEADFADEPALAPVEVTTELKPVEPAPVPTPDEEWQ